jgi:hypothetical protein
MKETHKYLNDTNLTYIQNQRHNQRSAAILLSLHTTYFRGAPIKIGIKFMNDGSIFFNRQQANAIRGIHDQVGQVHDATEPRRVLQKLMLLLVTTGGGYSGSCSGSSIVRCSLIGSCCCCCCRSSSSSGKRRHFFLEKEERLAFLVLSPVSGWIQTIVPDSDYQKITRLSKNHKARIPLFSPSCCY